MKKIVLSMLALACVGMMMTSCGVMSSAAGTGLFYTDVQTGVAVTSNTVGNKVGISHANGVLGLILTGDASIAAAAKDGGIKKISHVDQSQHSILGIITTYETIVYGE